MHSSGHESDSVSSTADFAQERAAPTRQKDLNQSLLDKLTQEKLDSKTKLGNKRNDLSSGIQLQLLPVKVLPTTSTLLCVVVFLKTFIN